ncbi:MAG: hypothetical protein QOF88_4880 [Mycobacterium sp.]|jgi:hypothetical protein|nr:hypothetical protein [Mycobacterium sp.]
MAEGGEEPGPRFRPWAVVTSALLSLILVTAVVWGVVLAYRGGQTPTQSYLLTAVLTILSIAGGWIVAILMHQSQSHDRQIAERRQQQDLERTARSAVMRSFRIMSTMARIQSAHPIAELRTRMRVIREGSNS